MDIRDISLCYTRTIISGSPVSTYLSKQRSKREHELQISFKTTLYQFRRMYPEFLTPSFPAGERRIVHMGCFYSSYVER
eukprot:scaffold26676_cov146-Skeletonema_menzelii.AAC.3